MARAGSALPRADEFQLAASARVLLTWRRDAPRQVELWDTDTLRPLSKINLPAEATGVAALSADGRRLAVGGQEATWLCDARSGQVMHSLDELPQPVDLAFSADGQTVTVLDSQTVHFINMKTGLELSDVGLRADATLQIQFDAQSTRLLVWVFSKAENGICLVQLPGR